MATGAAAQLRCQVEVGTLEYAVIVQSHAALSRTFFVPCCQYFGQLAEEVWSWFSDTANTAVVWVSTLLFPSLFARLVRCQIFVFV